MDTCFRPSLKIDVANKDSFNFFPLQILEPHIAYSLWLFLVTAHSKFFFSPDCPKTKWKINVDGQNMHSNYDL